MTRDEVENLARALRELLDKQRDNEAELSRLRLMEFGVSAGQTLRRRRLEEEVDDAGNAALRKRFSAAWFHARAELDKPEAPIDMVLFCPACGKQHIDASMTDAEYAEHLHESSWWELGGDKPERWTNPPHRSHLCAGCGHIWRPADVATNGVAAIQTKGKNDSPIGACAAPAAPAVDTVPRPQVTRYSGGASHEGIGGRVWIRLDDDGPEVEYAPVLASTSAKMRPQSYKVDDELLLALWDETASRDDRVLAFGFAVAKRAAAAWRRTVDDMLTVCGGVASDDPRESIDRLINWHVQVALDPAVSSDAAALVESGKKAQQACDEAARQALVARKAPSFEPVDTKFDVAAIINDKKL